MATRVLVVESDGLLAETYRRFLAREGFDVRTARTADECLSSFLEFAPDAIMLEPDVMASRAGAASEFARNQTASIPIVVVTRQDLQRTDMPDTWHIGGAISPLLSNIFLHYVLDLWFEQEVKPRLRRDAYLIRYADDFVIGFRDHHDAQRVMDVVPKRFGKYGLTVHPTKTKLVPFRPPSSATRKVPRADRPGTFDLLGFTHYWARSLRGHWVVKLKTASDRFSRAVRSIDSWCRKHRHWSIPEQQQKLNEKLRGHYAYYGVTGNSESLSRFKWEVERRWRRWLDRRNRQRSMTWGVFRRLLQRYPLAPVRTSRSIYRRAAP